jgi:hypothetical protein
VSSSASPLPAAFIFTLFQFNETLLNVLFHCPVLGSKPTLFVDYRVSKGLEADNFRPLGVIYKLQIHTKDFFHVKLRLIEIPPRLEVTVP